MNLASVRSKNEFVQRSRYLTTTILFFGINAPHSKLLLPIKRAFFPFVDEADDENTEKHHHSPKAEPAKFL